MKTKFTAQDNKIGFYVWSLARNLLHVRRNLKFAKPGDSSYPDHAFLEGIENEAYHRYEAAKEYFYKEIRKENK